MWCILLLLILIIFIYILFAKFSIELDSTQNLFTAKFDSFASINTILTNDLVALEVKFFWWEKTYNLNNLLSGKTGKAKNKKTQNHSINKPIIKLINLIQSFKINKLFITIDTGNMPLNGALYPWFHLLSMKKNRTININFWGENIIIIHLENSLARMLWAYFKS